MRIKKFSKAYLRDTSGNFAMMFGLAMVPLLMATGMAIDINRLHTFDTKLQDAVDAAALYGTVIPDGMYGPDGNGTGDGGGGGDDGNGDGDDDDGGFDAGGGDDGDDGNSFEDSVRAHFEANLNLPDAEILYFDATPREDGSVAVTARAQIPAWFAQINGYPKMTASATTDADADSGEDLELVIAFDTTNSMGFDNTWTAAMGTLNNVLVELDQYTGQENFFVTLVPFSDRVNIGTDNDQWLDGPAPLNWNGCVEPREEVDGSFNWALDDDKPNVDPFEASIVGTTGGLAARGGGYPFCPNVAITGPTNNVSEITTAANGFVKSGTGRFDVGLAWTWRAMSREWRTEWPGLVNSGAADKERRQIAIFVTDGRTNAYDYELSASNSWGWNEGSVDGFENMEHVCDGMKADDIEIFMVRVNGNSHATQYMQNCSTSDEHYYEISTNAELELALKEVLKVVKEKVRITN